MRIIRVSLLTEYDWELFEYAFNRGWFTTVLGVGDAPTSRLLALVSFEPGEIKAVALLERQRRAATRKYLLKVSNFIWIDPLRLDDLKAALPSSVRRFFGLGLLGEGTGLRAMEAVKRLRPEQADEIGRLERALDRPPLRRGAAAEIVAMEKDAVGVALDIAGFDRSPIGEIGEVDDEEETPFLGRLQRASLVEDQIINHDAGVFADWDLVRQSVVGATDFELEGKRLTVINVNRLAPEHSLGVDLIYYHHTYEAFVLVQYKRMRREEIDEQERLVYRPDAHHREQVAQMRQLDTLAADPVAPREYRLNPEACYFKICNPETLDPYATALLPGMYLPLELSELLIDSGEIAGPAGGPAFSYETVERRLSNTLFTDLVQAGWVGTRGDVSAQLRPIVEFMVENGRSVVLAVESVRGAQDAS
jgi:hypothetical protein